MLVRIVKIEELSTPKVTFYTVLLATKEISEFEEFDELDLSSHEREHQILYSTITMVGKYGMGKAKFKDEGEAQAIPFVTKALIEENKNTRDFGIRLYVYVVNDGMIILLNGGIKTKRRPQDCPNVSAHFNRAQKIARALKKFLSVGIGDEEDPPFDITIPSYTQGQN